MARFFIVNIIMAIFLLVLTGCRLPWEEPLPWGEYSIKVDVTNSCQKPILITEYYSAIYGEKIEKQKTTMLLPDKIQYLIGSTSLSKKLDINNMPRIDNYWHINVSGKVYVLTMSDVIRLSKYTKHEWGKEYIYTMDLRPFCNEK